MSRDVEAAVRYPFQGEWPRRLLIGSVLVATLPLIVPGVILGGYWVRVLRSTMDGASEPPAFEAWEDLLVDGLYATGIGLGYYAPSYLLGFLLVSVGVALLVIPPVGLLFLVLALLFFVLPGYLLHGALANYALEGELRAGFELPTLRRFWTHPEYVVGTVVGYLLLGVGVLLVKIAGASLLGLLLVPPIKFGAWLVAYRVWGESIDETLPIVLEDESMTETTA